MPIRSLSLVLLTLIALLPGCRRDAGKTRLAFISNNPHQFWTFAQRGTEKAAEELGIVAEFRMPPKGNAEEQQQIIDDLLVKGVQGIAISPNDSKNMVDFFRLKVGKHVPIITVDSDVPDATARRAYLGTHNYRAGRAVGELVQKHVPQGGKLVIFVGKMDVQNAVERRQGVLDYLANVKSDEIVDKTPADARNVSVGKFILLDTRTDGGSEAVSQEQAEDILTKNPDIDVMVGLWAYNPPAMLRAAEKLKSKAVIVGFDENEETLIGIKQGKIVGTVVQSPFEFGRQSMKILAALAKGDDSILKTYKGIDAQNRIYIDHRVITPENVDSFHEEVRKMLGK